MELWSRRLHVPLLRFIKGSNILCNHEGGIAKINHKGSSARKKVLASSITSLWIYVARKRLFFRSRSKDADRNCYTTVHRWRLAASIIISMRRMRCCGLSIFNHSIVNRRTRACAIGDAIDVKKFPSSTRTRDLQSLFWNVTFWVRGGGTVWNQSLLFLLSDIPLISIIFFVIDTNIGFDLQVLSSTSMYDRHSFVVPSTCRRPSSCGRYRANRAQQRYVRLSEIRTHRLLVRSRSRLRHFTVPVARLHFVQ